MRITPIEKIKVTEDDVRDHFGMNSLFNYNSRRPSSDMWRAKNTIRQKKYQAQFARKAFVEGMIVMALIASMVALGGVAIYGTADDTNKISKENVGETPPKQAKLPKPKQP